MLLEIETRIMIKQEHSGRYRIVKCSVCGEEFKCSKGANEAGKRYSAFIVAEQFDEHICKVIV